MGSIGRYIFRTTLGAFLLVLVNLTLIIWVTQALREIDLVTTQGQSLLMFIGITSLIIPSLVLIIAPIAFAIAIAFVLNKLTTDSEIIVMNSAGMSPWRLMRGFIAAAAVVSVLVAVVAAYLSPMSLRELRRLASEARTNFLTKLVQPGRFVPIEAGLVFHIRDRQPNGVLLGVFINDQRDPKEMATFLAEEGEIIQNPQGTFLILDNGTAQRHPADQRDPTIVHYDRYAFDLSRFTVSNLSFFYSARERDFVELLNPNTEDPVYKRSPAQFRTELHDRLLLPVYPLAFAVIAFAFLGSPRTNRQSRATAIGGYILAVSVLRVAAFAATAASLSSPTALAVPYALLIGTFILGLLAISRGLLIEPPAFVLNVMSFLAQRMTRRVATT